MRYLPIILVLLLLPAHAGADEMKKKQRPKREQVKRVDPQAWYDNLWNRSSRFFGAEGQPAPRVTWDLPPEEAAWGTPAQVVEGSDGIRQVQVGRKMRRGIRRGKQAEFGPDPRRVARRQLLHEWAHVYQKPELWNQNRDLPHSSQPVEQAAINFGNATSTLLGREQKLQRARKQGFKRKVRRLRRKPPPTYDTTQFGSYYGRNPLTIRYYDSAYPGASTPAP